MLLRVSTRLKDIEDELKSNSAQSLGMRASNSRSSMVLAGSTASNFYSDGGYHTQQPPPLVQFRAIRENQLIRESAPTQAFASGYTPIESSELLYKIFRGETRLVRSILEQSGFAYTESHDWNVLWSNSGCKTYLYEGLNEH